MPVVAAFFGIVIRMFYQEHGPPHFHAEHHSQQASFTLNGKLFAGVIRSRTARRRIQRWARLHREDRERNWERLRNGLALERIPPLE